MAVSLVLGLSLFCLLGRQYAAVCAVCLKGGLVTAVASLFGYLVGGHRFRSAT